MANDSLFGNWQLKSLQFEFSDTKERADLFGADPFGYLLITPDNRMMTIITSRGRTAPNSNDDEIELFRTMMAYCGPFRLVGSDQFIATAEVAWHPAWVGTEQARYFALDGDKLSITTARQTHPMFGQRLGRGVLSWERA